MALFLFLVLVALVLGVLGTVLKGLLYLLIIGIVVFVLALVYLAVRFRLSGRRPSR